MTLFLKILQELSGGELKLDENASLSSYQELRATLLKKFFHKNNKHKGGHHKHKQQQ